MRPSGRPNRRIRLPKRYINDVPPQPPQIEPDTQANPTIREPTPEDSQPAALSWLYTTSNSFGVYHGFYGSFPSFNPDKQLSLDLQCDSPNFSVAGAENASERPWWSAFGKSVEEVEADLFALFSNPSVYRLMNWLYSGSNLKSFTEVDKLVHNVLLAPDFSAEHLRGFRSTREADRLDKHLAEGSDNPFSVKDGWLEAKLKLPLPCEWVKQTSEREAAKFIVEGVYHRHIMDVIKSVIGSMTAEQFHIAPFKSYWQSAEGALPERIYSELYTADAFLEEQQKIGALPQRDGEVYENVIVALMFWSDSTRLAQFGHASLWPVYMYFGNQSKYTRAKPSSFAAHHMSRGSHFC